MAYSASALLKVAGGATGIFYYKSTDALSTVVASGYFNDATNELKEHDIIFVVASTGGTETVDMVVVTSAPGASTVTVANGT